MTATQTYTGTLTVLTCSNCRITFGIPLQMETDRRRDHKTFYCPMGHGQHWPQRSDIEQARDEARWERERREALDDIVQSERRSHAATKGRLTKMKKRVGAGVCPCCNRHFESLDRHMQSQHPSFKQGDL